MSQNLFSFFFRFGETTAQLIKSFIFMSLQEEVVEIDNCLLQLLGFIVFE